MCGCRHHSRLHVTCPCTVAPRPNLEGTGVVVLFAGMPDERRMPVRSRNAASYRVLPTFEDTFERPPRVWPARTTLWGRATNALSSLFQNPNEISRELPKQSESGASVPHLHAQHEQAMPRTYQILGDTRFGHLRGYRRVKKVVVIGVHGWNAQSVLKNVMGPTFGTSAHFAEKMAESVRSHFQELQVPLDDDAITNVAVQYDGRVGARTEHYFESIVNTPAWSEALREADAVFVAAHSQGSIVATLLLARLYVCDI